MYAFSKKLIYFFSSDLHVADFDIEVNVKVKKTYVKNLDYTYKKSVAVCTSKAWWVLKHQMT